MALVACHISISLDGFVAGPNQTLENPIGEGGMRLHQWVFETASWREQQGLEGGAGNADSAVADEVARDVGAYIVGRKMFDGGQALGTRRGRAGGATSRPTMPPSSC